ncbi:hypothetical protein [Chryseolinea sp. H1M3-3]|uniref:hypothetical protein n=1 Tax=Chryseolinea sp. H1M3-3 TaxID=3034144 RepID=UPI0023ED27D1|nr:hypothetical protein [Chryseolinea sp. H1M3-3]
MISNTKKRRGFLKAGILLAGSYMSFPAVGGSANPTNLLQHKEPLNPELVKEFVAKAHKDLDSVKMLLEKEPNLLNVAWDWGLGDFETAIAGAGHMGRVDIAEFLLSKGARMDVFVAAMLGKLDIVKSTLEAFPQLKYSKGPHGIMLLHHARQGKENAKPVLDYLMEIGAT